jgi:malate synthase
MRGVGIIFSVMSLKKSDNHTDFILPDRVQLTMRVPFMKTYAELLVKTCHK